MSFSLRFITDTPHTAAFNMAADLYLMKQCLHQSVVTIRFYQWEPAAITLGCMQRADEQLDFKMLKQNGISWIRRPTGGRAVLHQEDLTYSCIFAQSLTGLGSTVAATYEVITRSLHTGLKSVGVITTIQDSISPLIKSGREVKLPCFLAPNRNELMADGKKLVGSAQYRNASAVLQHGSLPLTAAYRSLPLYLPLSDKERNLQIAHLKRKSCALCETGDSIALKKLIAGLKNGFIATLGCSFIEKGWTEEELTQISALMNSSSFRKRWMEYTISNQ